MGLHPTNGPSRDCCSADRTRGALPAGTSGPVVRGYKQRSSRLPLGTDTFTELMFHWPLLAASHYAAGYNRWNLLG
ncbi:hypothetical protein GCM10009762_13500 [Dermacoccus barathri]|uniref:Uncharacterized protein n=1 Tax=Dermacoccus barathri TaxID=322601 RepID=A0ABN2BKE3_9MICO